MVADRALLQALPLAAVALRHRKARLSIVQPNPPDIVTWAEQHFWVPELNGPMQLAPYQQRVLREIFRPGDDGLLRYSTIVWSDVKKSIKSTIGAAVCLWWADTHPWASVRIIANDLKQADSREGEYIRRAIELNRPYFIDQRGAHVRPSGCSVTLANHSYLESVPLDPTGEAGGGDDIVAFTELWGARNDAAKRMWTEVTLSPLKFGKSFRWVETYAGFTGASPLLEQLYDVGVKQGERIDDDLEMYANPAARLFVFWNTKPGMLPWLTPEYYAQEAATLTPSEFLRVHRNQWVAPVEQAIPVEWWAVCEDKHPLLVGRDGIGERTPLVVAVDASVSGDCTALSVVSRHPTQPGHVCERHTRIWTPPHGGKMDYDATISPEIERLVKTFNVVEVAYDPYQLHQWAIQTRNRLGVRVYEFNQGMDRLIADKGLYDLVRDRKLHHSGNPTLAEHVSNCDAKTDEGDSKLRFVKRKADQHIDAAVALSMATHECLRLNL